MSKDTAPVVNYQYSHSPLNSVPIEADSWNQCKMDSRKGDSSTNSALVVGILAAGALTFSPSSQAGIGNILEDMKNKLMEGFGPIIEDAMGSFGGALTESINGSYNKLSTMLAQATDTQIKGMEEMEQSRLKRAAEPPPDYCESNIIGSATKVSKENSDAALSGLVSSSARNTASNNKDVRHLDKIELIGPRYADPASPNFQAHLMPFTNKPIQTDSERKAALDHIDTIAAVAENNIQLVPNEATAGQLSVRQHYIANSSAKGRLEIAKYPLYRNLSNNFVPDGGSDSLNTLLDKEIDRTYGNEAWRSKLENYADPTPLLAELCKLTALSNHIANEQLKSLRIENQTTSATLIELMSDPRRMTYLRKVY